MKIHRLNRAIAVCTTALLAVGLALVGAAAPSSAANIPVTLCHATPPDTAASGWNLLRDIDDDAVVREGHTTQHDADIIPAFGTFPGQNLATLFGWGATGQQILDNGCVLPAQPPSPEPTIVTPPAASMLDSCGTENDSIVIPADGTGYSFSGTGGDIFLTPAADYAFPPGTVTEWHFQLTNEPCAVVPVKIPVPEPGFSQATCDAPAGLALSDFPNGSWSWAGSSAEAFTGEPANMQFGVPYTVTAVADSGFVVTGSPAWTFTFTAPVDCAVVPAPDVVVVVPPVAFQDACGPDNEVLTDPAVIEGVVYAKTSYVDADGGTVLVVTATAATGFVLSFGGELSPTVTQEFPVNDEPCPVTPPDPIVVPVDPPVDPVVDPPVDPVVDPPADPAVDPIVDPPADPAVDPIVDPPADPAVDPVVEVVDPVVEPAVVAPVTAVVTAAAHTTVLPSTGSNDGGLGFLAVLLCLAGAGVFGLGRTRLVRRPLAGLTSGLHDGLASRAGNGPTSRPKQGSADGPHLRN